MPSFILHLDSCKHFFEKFKLKKESFDFALAAIGSIIVDIDEIGVIKKAHGRSRNFLKYLLKTDPKYAPLAIGMIMHEELDHAMDTNYINPHISKATALLKKHNIKHGKISDLGHSLIDHSIDCAAIENNPQLIKLVKRVRKRVKHHHFHKIAYHISTFFDGDQKAVLKVIEELRDFDISQLLSHEKAAELYSRYLFFANKKTKIKRLTLLERSKLALKYFKFVLMHEKQKTKNLLLQAKTHFQNYDKVYSKAKKTIVKHLKKTRILEPVFSPKDL